MNEAETRAKLIDPAIHKRGWTEELVRREETAGAIEIVDGRAVRRKGRADYVLRVQVAPNTQPVALALLEAKKKDLPPGHGLDQAKLYAHSKRLNVKFVFSSNGHMFVEYDAFTGTTSQPKPLDQFPTPDELRSRYEEGIGFELASQQAKALVQPYAGGEGARRYYQDAAIRAVMEKVAQAQTKGEDKRALLSLATGAGKTFIAVNLLKRFADAGQLTRALFVCDRDELRNQGIESMHQAFGSDAAEVFRTADSNNNAKNARIHVATFQTLGVESDTGSPDFLETHYPENYFSHIVIDECHRSAWGKWSKVLTRNPNAAQIGLTATPRELEPGKSPEALHDKKISADNIAYFGDPVYEYDLAQAIEDGYLAACEIVKGRVDLDIKDITKQEIVDKNPTDPITGLQITAEVVKDTYKATQFEDKLMLPDRVAAMCRDLFDYLVQTGGPEQKTVIFCTRDKHADDVAACLNNLYAEWCKTHGKIRAEFYAFKCTAASSGNDQLPDLRGATRSHFIATTVDLLTTGVDVPCLRNVVFFRYLSSPIMFYQMVGRGTRIHAPSGKLMFRIYDYTNATRLFGNRFVTKPTTEPKGTGDGDHKPPTPIQVDGFEVSITPQGRFVVANVDGKAMPIPVEEYKAKLAEKLVTQTPTLDAFRTSWVDPGARKELLNELVLAGYSPGVVRLLDGMEDYDYYDVLAQLGWGMRPRTQQDRAHAFVYKHEEWLGSLPQQGAATLRAIARQFERAGTDGLENPNLWKTPDVLSAGGLAALQAAGDPRELVRETKQRMFSA